MNLKKLSLIVLMVLLAALPFVVTNQYYLDVAIRIGINACVVIALNLMVGYSGQISLGHAGFFGLGAYFTAVTTSKYMWAPSLALIIGAAVTGVLAFLIAKPILRLKSNYLAMATLGLGIIISIVLANETAFTGGPDGMPVVPLSIAGFTISGERSWYWLILGLLIIISLLAKNLINSPYGRDLHAFHGSEVAAKVAGVDVTQIKVSIFVLSASIASFMGGLYAHYLEFITPGISNFLHSIELITMVVVGGMASIMGSIVGAALLTMLPQVLAAFEGWETVVYGVILIVTMAFLPKGLVPSISQ
jgi:branched-chain amino acid transport system permease protein